MSTPLIPPDKERCQAEITAYRPFILGGNVRKTDRCENKPVFIATENEEGPDGQKGAMSLCAECADEMKKLMGGDFATLTSIGN